MASQAVGKKHGVAKGATLVSVKLKTKDRVASDFSQGLEAVLQDLSDNPNRQSKAVVISSLGFGSSTLTYEQSLTDPDANVMRPYFEKLFKMGVPFISSAGNRAEIQPTIRRLPKIIQDDDYPIINVGAVGLDGSKAKFSQDGDQLTISAPGVDVTGKNKDGTEGTLSGTPYCESTNFIVHRHTDRRIQPHRWLQVLSRHISTMILHRGTAPKRVKTALKPLWTLSNQMPLARFAWKRE